PLLRLRPVRAGARVRPPAVDQLALGPTAPGELGPVAGPPRLHAGRFRGRLARGVAERAPLPPDDPALRPGQPRGRTRPPVQALPVPPRGLDGPDLPGGGEPGPLGVASALPERRDPGPGPVAPEPAG